MGMSCSSPTHTAFINFPRRIVVSLSRTWHMQQSSLWRTTGGSQGRHHEEDIPLPVEKPLDASKDLSPLPLFSSYAPSKGCDPSSSTANFNLSNTTPSGNYWQRLWPKMQALRPWRGRYSPLPRFMPDSPRAASDPSVSCLQSWPPPDIVNDFSGDNPLVFATSILLPPPLLPTSTTSTLTCHCLRFILKIHLLRQERLENHH